jgi:Domain of unknown function (DUF4160)
MDNQDPNVESWLKAIDRELLIYDWHHRSLGHDVQREIEQLEEKVYAKIWENVDREILWQRDIDELQLLLSLADPEPQRDEAFVTKKRFYSLQNTHLTIDNSKNHSRPHFHLRYKNEYSGSYAIDNLECLAGFIPKKYEERMLEWASRHQRSLRLTWDKLQAGEIVRELILDAAEEQV